MSITVQTLFGTYNEEELKAIKSCLREMSECMSKINNEKELMKDIVGTTHDKFKIPKKIFKKMSNVYYKQSFQEIVSENNEFEALFEGVNEVK